MKIEALSWEGLIETIRRYDSDTADELEQFYKACLEYNKIENISNETLVS